jgi:tetratricopeptide (TPR) repeat protein
MHSAKIANVIIFTPRKDLAKLATDHLKMKGVSNIAEHSTATETIDSLTRFPKGLLIIDWQAGEMEVAKVLSFNRKRHPDELRPMLLVADKISDQIVATAAEYSVSQIYTEGLNLKALGARLTSLIMVETAPNDVKRVLNDVAEARKVEDWKKSLALLQKALTKHPNNLRLKCEVAESLMYMDQLENALKVLEGMSKTRPPYLRGHHMLARCLLKLGRPEEAHDILQSTMLLNPFDSDRLVDFGRVLFQMERFQEANAQFEAALRIDEKNRDALLGKSQCSLMDGDVNDALAIIQEVSTPLEMASIFNTCAVMTIRKGKHEAGMGLYRTAMKAIGTNQKLQARLFFNMGIGYRRSGQKEKAKACYENAVKLDPKFTKAQEHIEHMNAPQAAPAPTAKSGDIAEPGIQPSLMPAKAPETAPPQNPGLPDFMADLESLLEDDLEESIYNAVS